jgi:hypothetical protein
MSYNEDFKGKYLYQSAGASVIYSDGFTGYCVMCGSHTRWSSLLVGHYICCDSCHEKAIEKLLNHVFGG